MVLCLLVWMLALSGCAGTPRLAQDIAISPDMRTIACFERGAFGAENGAVLLIDRETGGSRKAMLPDSWRGEKILWIGNRVYLRAERSRRWGGLLLREDGTWTEAPLIPQIWYPAFTGEYKGQAVVFSPENATHILASRDLSELARLDYPLRSAGGGYALRYHWGEGPPMALSSAGWIAGPAGAPALERIELLGPDLSSIMVMERAAMMATPAQRFFMDAPAQISSDRRQILIAPRRSWGGGSGGPGRILSHEAGFAVLEIPSGTVAYTSDAAAPTHGRRAPVLPFVLVDGAVYAVEEVVPENDVAGLSPAQARRAAEHEFWLARYTSAGRDDVVHLPLRASHPRGQVLSSAACVEGKFMILHTYEPSPRLLELPLKPTVKPEEIRQYRW